MQIGCHILMLFLDIGSGVNLLCKFCTYSEYNFEGLYLSISILRYLILVLFTPVHFLDSQLLFRLKFSKQNT